MTDVPFSLPIDVCFKFFDWNYLEYSKNQKSDRTDKIFTIVKTQIRIEPTKFLQL
jgi:hypothetical protein